MAPLSITADARDHLDPWGFGRGGTDDLTGAVEYLDPLDEFVDDDEELPTLITLPVAPAGRRAGTARPSLPSAPHSPHTARALATLRLPVSSDRVGVLALFGAVIVAQAFYIGFSLTGEASARRGVGGEVLVSSRPSGAPVTVDGRLHDATPPVDAPRVDTAAPAARVLVEPPAAAPVAARPVRTTVTARTTATVPVDAPRVAVHLNATPWAEVRVDGRLLGETPLANALLAIGPHTLTFTHPELGERVETVVVRAGGPNRVAVDLRQDQP